MDQFAAAIRKWWWCCVFITSSVFVLPFRQFLTYNGLRYTIKKLLTSSTM